MIDAIAKSETGAWRVEEAEEGFAFLVFDLPDEKVNILSESVLRDLDRILDSLARASKLEALVVIGGKEDSGTFIAGASVHEIRQVESAVEASNKAALGQEVLGKLASLPAVTVAAIHGACLGGGTELALACDLRVATSDARTRIGFPEVQLGIIPGFGGTQRLPRLVGIMGSLPLILTGKPQDARKAARIGLVDRVVYPGRLREEALALARHAVQNGGKSFRPRRPARPWYLRALEALPPGRAFIRRRARKDILSRVGPNYPAPLKALEAVLDGTPRSLADGLKLEASLVGELVASSTSKNLIDLFLASEKARRGPASGEAGDADAAGPSCLPSGSRIGLLGAGVMGGGLAALLARKGCRVRMKDIAHESVQNAYQKVHELYSARRKRRRMSRHEVDGALAAISATLDYSGFESVEFVIEAVVENLDVKKQVLAEVEAVIPETAVLASNTSSLSISEMQRGLQRPEQFLGIHFFNPVDRMLLVEIVRGEQTGDAAVAAAMELARKLGKIPVPVGDGPGFLVNRLLGPYLNEAVRLFEEEYSPAEIDRTIRRFGMPMGPFELLDEVGLDIAAKVGQVLFEAFGERAEPPPLMTTLRSMSSLLGKKSGQGFYLYGAKKKAKKEKTLNPVVLGMGGTRGKGFRADDPDLWIKRLVYPVINEAARALDEKIADVPSVVDLAMVMGTGFAPFRGGPLRYADTLGVRQVVEGLKNLRESRLAPCELIERFASEDKGFYSLENEGSAPEKKAGTLQPAES
ncbi:MAG: 3-hydroxyacyl-CoA dehydrogenase NAD-binding domain-containing protein [Planctomycetota bacterium]|nr:3-hydroxyacyl-CoA dehydrogenase NAD-binding domain-containing protein [Planctomycetota bacterium]